MKYPKYDPKIRRAILEHVQFLLEDDEDEERVEPASDEAEPAPEEPPRREPKRRAPEPEAEPAREEPPRRAPKRRAPAPEAEPEAEPEAAPEAEPEAEPEAAPEAEPAPEEPAQREPKRRAPAPEPESEPEEPAPEDDIPVDSDTDEIPADGDSDIEARRKKARARVQVLFKKMKKSPAIQAYISDLRSPIEKAEAIFEFARLMGVSPDDVVPFLQRLRSASASTVEHRRRRNKQKLSERKKKLLKTLVREYCDIHGISVREMNKKHFKKFVTKYYGRK